eukprot:2801513-Rhodomonas_salina.3
MASRPLMIQSREEIDLGSSQLLAASPHGLPSGAKAGHGGRGEGGQHEACRASQKTVLQCGIEAEQHARTERRKNGKAREEARRISQSPTGNRNSGLWFGPLGFSVTAF